MGDAAVVLMAAAAALGAMSPRPVPLAAGLALAALALSLRRPLVLMAAVYVVASTMSYRAWSGLESPPRGGLDGVAVLMTDPERFGPRVRADVRLAGRRYEAWAQGDAGAVLASRLAGERVEIAGKASAPRPGTARRLAVRHVAGRLDVTTATAVDGGSLPARAGNAIRRVFARGAETLPRDEQALLNGVVLGDDRQQPPELEDDFRASGLSHLLAVSGQNVAFMLALAAPLLGRMPLRARLATGVGLLLLFGLITRWEPSVLRAVAMAGLTMTAAVAGRPQPGFRVLALAVTGLVVIDPLLVHRPGFLLSVGACAGIAALARPVAAAVPGPRPLADALGVTVAAQIGVAPVLIPVFGPMPLASIPANLLAVPVAGPLMMWGMTAGVVAGAAGERVAAVLHLPTRLMLGWVAGVARIATRLPLGRITLGHVVAAVAGTAAVVVARRAGPAYLRVALAVVAGAAVVGGTVAGLRPIAGRPETANGTRIWAALETSIVVTDGADTTAAVLAEIRRRNVRRPSLLVVTGGGRTAAAQVGPVIDRVHPSLVVVPATVNLPGARRIDGPSRVTSGPFVVDIAPVGASRHRLRVEVGHRRATVAGDAPLAR